MIKLIVGEKGSGKTKQMVDMINSNIGKVKGNIVCIEKSMQLTYNIDTSVRLIDVDEYKIDNYEKFYGFFAGVLAGDYDIEQVYIDGILKVGNKDVEGLGDVLEKIDAITKEIQVVISLSLAVIDIPDDVKKYI
ncbi:MAG: hypothetical protein RR253_07535 [Oscillospiraceae bacterium]